MAAEPQWIQNLRAASTAHLQVKDRQVDVAVRLAEGEELERLWREVVLTRAPGFADDERKSGRTMPVAVLAPTA